MGHLMFGNLATIRGVVTYSLSPYEQRAFAGLISKGIPNTIRRFRESFFRIAPIFLVGYLIIDQTEKKYKQLGRKNPADYECDV